MVNFIKMGVFKVDVENISLIQASENHLPYVFKSERRIFEDYLTKLDGEYIPEVWEDRLRNDLSRTFILKSGDSVLGHFRYKIAEGLGYLYALQIEEEYQGKGLGEYLLNLFFNKMKGKGISLVQWSCPRSFEANNFYKHLGFKVVEEDELRTSYEFELDDK